MSGTVITILDRTQYRFASVVQGQDVVIRAAQNIDISQWPEGTLMVRVHAKEIAASSGSKIKVALIRVLPSAEDPSVDFADEENPMALIELDDVVGQSNLLYAALPANTGPMVSLLVVGDQAGSGDLSATISVVLSLKS